MNQLAVPIVLGLALAIALSPVLAEPEPVASPAAEAVVPAAPDEVHDNIFFEWLESQHELGKGDTECVMCAGFGGAVVCGMSCDATGLTIRKPDGSINRWCGRCDSGSWTK